MIKFDRVLIYTVIGHIICYFISKQVLQVGWDNSKRMFFCLGIETKCSLISSCAEQYLEKKWQLI